MRTDAKAIDTAAAVATMPAVQPDVHQSPERAAPRVTIRRKPAYSDLYNKLGYTLALIGAFTLAGWLWFVGATYTISGLTLFGITTDSVAWFALPISITAIELWLMPRKNMHGLMIMVFLAILAFDMLTSWYGLTLDLAGKRLPLGAGWQLPNGGVVFHGGCVLLSLVFAFAPEKIARVAYQELVGTWL
jgi:hypothetical protein